MKAPTLFPLLIGLLSFAAQLALSAGEPKAVETMTTAEKAKEIADLMTAQEKNLARMRELVDGGERSATVMFFHGGVRLLSPYQVKPQTDAAGNVVLDPNGKQHSFLEKSDGTTSGFVEFVYSNRWAWNEQRIRATDEQSKKVGWVISESFGDSHFWDFDARMVYNFSKGGGSDASAIVGSGDFGIEVTASRQLNRSRLPGSAKLGDGAASFGLDLCYGLTTDKSSFDAHHRILGALNYSVSKPNESGRWTLLTLRIGYGAVENVNFVREDSREVKLKHGDVVDYDLKPAVGFEAELFYPLGKDAAVTLGTRVYGKLSPNPWTVYVGYTKSISDVFKGILPNTETTPPAKPASKGPLF
ncbi:MAG: hypothetical protein FJ399_02745 [Verrucomicrobia bacterium]|nr:hypothetical protein [Verrucomicrobiota bacterium]